MDMRRLVGANVARLRRARGLTQEQLEARSGFSQQYLSDLEQGRRNPTVVMLHDLAQALDTTPQELLRPDSAEAWSSAGKRTAIPAPAVILPPLPCVVICMTRLRILSDVHLEVFRDPDAFGLEPPDCDVPVVAGDVCQGQVARGLAVVQCLAAGRPSVMVLGNHEFWNGRLEPVRQQARTLVPQHGVTLLDDDGADLAGVRFVGGTLWGDGALAGPDAAPDRPTGEPISLGDCGQPRPVTGADQTVLHGATRAVIATAVAVDDPRPLVVVTHHAPHPCCLPPELQRGWIAGHTASDLSELTDAGRVAAWIYGHVHHTVEHRRPGGTRLLCNAAGPRLHNRAFRRDWVVVVPTP